MDSESISWKPHVFSWLFVGILKLIQGEVWRKMDGNVNKNLKYIRVTYLHLIVLGALFMTFAYSESISFNACRPKVTSQFSARSWWSRRQISYRILSRIKLVCYVLGDWVMMLYSSKNLFFRKKSYPKHIRYE